MLVGALVAAGYRVIAVNPLAVDRYRDRHAVSGAKSDAGDARVLADLVRTDAHLHRTVAGDSDLAEAVKVLARAHQTAVWSRQRQVNQLRSALREYYPAALAAFGADLDSPDALTVLTLAPTPELGRRLSRSKTAAALRRAGRQRNVDTRAEAIWTALRGEQLTAPALVADAYGAVALRIITVLNDQIDVLEQELGVSLTSTRTPRSYAASPGWAPCWAPGCSQSSATTRTATPTPKPAATTPAPARSPARPDAA